MSRPDADRHCGLHAVSALFRRRPDDVLRLFFTEDLRMAAASFAQQMAAMRRPYRLVPAEELATVAGTTHHGGICAVAKPRWFEWLDPAKPPRTTLLLVLDGVANPHNLGAIARSAAFFGLGHIVLSDHPQQARLSDAAYRTAEGGFEHLTIWRSQDLVADLRAFDRLYRTVAAMPGEGAVPLPDLPRDRPIMLVLGNEESGVRSSVASACRRRVRIVGSADVESLNVAQSAAVLAFALGGIFNPSP
jgi:TrmH RNA methyltransferase